jgi:hypothetical protein
MDGADIAYCVPHLLSIMARASSQIAPVASTSAPTVKWTLVGGRVGTVATVGSMRPSGPYLDSMRPSGMALSSRAARATGQLESSRSSALRR